MARHGVLISRSIDVQTERYMIYNIMMHVVFFSPENTTSDDAERMAYTTQLRKILQ
jgi:hypothetical protein